MTTDVTILRSSSWSKYWPAFVAGVISPPLGLIVARWLPAHVAFGLTFFFIWFFAGLIFARRTPPPWGLPIWLAALFIGAVVGGFGLLLSFFFPWN